MKANTIYKIIGIFLIPFLLGCGEDEKEVSDLSVPEVTTEEVSEITSNSATCGGFVIGDGGYTVTSRGVCYGLSSQPTIENQHITSASGKGNFECYLSDLKENTVYYARAYATNQMGTSYGSQKSFTTEKEVETPPTATVTTVALYQTSSEYSASGFVVEGSSYNYKFEWTIEVKLTGASYVSQFGYIMNGEYRYWNNLEDKTYSESWTTHTNTNTINYKCKAYAKLLNGSYIYGEEKTLVLSYGTKAVVSVEEDEMDEVLLTEDNVTSIKK